jgi:hypothetical protein
LEAADSLESAALTDLDTSFFEEDNMLALIPPSRLIKLGLALRSMILPSLAERVDQIAEDADLDEEPDSHFKKLLGVLERIEAIADDLDTASMIDDTRDQVKRSVKAIEERKRKHDESSEDETDWTHIVTQKKDAPTSTPPLTAKRSVFDDVDK